MEFAKTVIRLCKDVKQSVINRELVSQLVRAAGSIGANYREASEALSRKDFGHRVKIARKEASEAHYWLQLLKEADADSSNLVDPLLQEARELRNILTAIAKKVEQ